MVVKNVFYSYIVIVALIIIYLIFSNFDTLKSIVIRRLSNYFYTTFAIIFLMILKHFFREDIAELCGYGVFSIYWCIFNISIVAVSNLCDNKFDLVNCLKKTIITLTLLGLNYYCINEDLILSVMQTRTEPISVTIFNKTGFSLPPFEGRDSFIAIFSPYLLSKDTIENLANPGLKELASLNREKLNKEIYQIMNRCYFLPSEAWVFVQHNFPAYVWHTLPNIVEARIMCFMLEDQYNKSILSSSGEAWFPSRGFLNVSGQKWLKKFVHHNKDNPAVSQEFRNMCDINYITLCGEGRGNIRVNEVFLKELRTWTGS